ncbi:aminotransferase A [Pontibacillus yanchengensis]|uniref:Aminotransferase A n=2 Tax=Pontibacillus yanchengensis TaxID=462910 RepID=A0ACC7VBV0_9BACI|nr:aminotransferase A [Pontibacillus yanchengensis]MYL34796.1 aminotransferase A [Pontibacillus yanchengensis]MYL52218.1 aminotransferase A [Pontibacillus yanchengensis]
MEHLLNPRLQGIEISGIRKFFNMVSEKKDIVSLTIGQPDFPTPTHIKEAGKYAIDHNHTTYTHNAGMLPLRNAISSFVKDEYNLDYDPNSEIIVSVGASQAIDITFRTILTPGDEVLLPAPVYPGYEPLIKLAGATPVHVDTTASNFKWNVELLQEHITENTKCIVLPYPSNPTGATMSSSEVRELSKFLKDYDIFLLSDEIYSQLTYEETHTSIASFDEVRNQTIVINGVSKSHSMTGWRIGYALAPEWLSKHMLKVHQYNVSCPSSISQHAALEALTNGKSDTELMRKEYKKRLDYVYDRLKKMGIEMNKPGGAFYLFPKFPTGGMSSFEIGINLVEKAGLAIVPGDAFSEYGQGYMRISYAYDINTLKLGMDRLENYLKENKLV